MSSRPNPVALTSAMLMQRLMFKLPTGGTLSDKDCHAAADLSSKLHRIAPAFKRHAEALCNGEMREGQRARCYANDARTANALAAELDQAIEAEGLRLQRKLASLNAVLDPFGVRAHTGGDPRGKTLWLISYDPSRPIVGNGWDRDCWVIG